MIERIFSKFLCVLFPRRVGKLFWGWNILENKGRFKRRWINHICENWRFCIPDLISWKRTMEVTWKRTSEDRLLVQTFSACARDNTGSIPNLVCILWLGKIKLRSLGYVSSPYWIFCFRDSTLGSACDTVLLFRWSVRSPKWTKCLNGFYLCWWLGCEVGSLIQILFKFVPSLTAFDLKLSSI